MSVNVAVEPGAADGLSAVASRARSFALGPGLPVFLLAAVVPYEAALLAIIFAPWGQGLVGDFAVEFKRWCFNYDPRTGGMEWAAVWVMLCEPLLIVGVTVALWWRALTARRKGWPWLPAVGGLAVAALAIGVVASVARPGAEEELPPFPGERIRTRIVPPGFRLKDQRGLECSLEGLRGRVVLVTGVYAACSTACPEILRETRRLLDSLPAEARARLSVVALSLDPEYETTDLMAAVAAGHGFEHPDFRYLNGAPATMLPLLETLQFGRTKNPTTGVIEHANLFILLDAEGLIAYRFNTGARHRTWLREAVLSLAAEAGGRESQ